MKPLTFVYRDLRQQRVTKAIDALRQTPDAGLQEQLTAEQSRLSFSTLPNSDRAFLAYVVDWLWVTPPDIRGSIKSDPVLRLLSIDPRISDAQIAAIEALPTSSGPVPLDFIEKIRSALGDDVDAVAELAHAAYRELAANYYPFDDVGVMLPLRLETLFDAPTSAKNPDPLRWKLSLRVIPDEVSIRRDNVLVSDGEHQALIDFWNAAAPPTLAPPFVMQTWLDSDAGKTAWANFYAKASPARAAWLAAAYQPELDASGNRLTVKIPATSKSKDPQPNRVSGLPPRLGVWVITALGQRERIGTLPMNPTQTIDNQVLSLPMPGTAGEDAKKSWWANWDRAKEVGLGGEWLLPAGITPDTIEALYVVGVGDETPNEHFRAQSDAGELGTLQLGAPTNAIHGAPVAHLANDAESWRTVVQARIAERTALAHSRLAQFLTGDAAAIPAFPGATLSDQTSISQQIAQALWPALWGNWARSIWRIDEEAHCAAHWAFENLFPEGPLPPLRISEQPYGLLPVTALSQWQVGPEVISEQQRKVEQNMAQTLASLRGHWANAARNIGNVVGKDAAGFLDLLGRDALSTRYIARNMADPIAAVLGYGLSTDQAKDFLGISAKAYGVAVKLMPQEPTAFYLAMGNVDTQQLPLVAPSRMTSRDTGDGRDPQRVTMVELLEQMLGGVTIEKLFAADAHDMRWHVLPNSLLLRLLIYACQLTADWKASHISQQGSDVLDRQAKAALNLVDEWYDRRDWWSSDKHPRTGQERFLLSLSEPERLRLERAFRATIDSATHRIDPWITGFAWQRLNQHSGSARQAYRLGAYGWIDGPILGKPGPTDAGRLHAPSHGQAIASLVLRDKYLSSQPELTDASKSNPWQMNIDSRKARLAQDLADEVRLGFHIHEILGRRVEHIIGVHQKVKELRLNAQYAMYPERIDPNQVCHGVKALRGLLTGDPNGVVSQQHLRLDQPALPIGDRLFPLNDDQRLHIKLLYLALDTYADLLMADGVMQLTSRQPERAAETMDATSGFSRPPTLEFIRTPPSGYLLETRVLTVLPYVSVATIKQTESPYLIAEPSLLKFIQSQLGSEWMWKVVDDAGNVQVITLADLGLSVADALALSGGMLADFARVVVRAKFEVDVAKSFEPHRADLAAWSWNVKDEAGIAHAISLVDLSLTEAEALKLSDLDLANKVFIFAKVKLATELGKVISPAQYRLARQLSTLLGSRPAAGRDFAADGAKHKTQDVLAYNELVARYRKLHKACLALLKKFTTATNDTKRRVAIRAALRWGITPIAVPQDKLGLLAALIDTTPPVEATPLKDLCARAQAALQARFDASPLATNLPLTIDGLASAICALATTDGKLSILAKWRRAQLLAQTELKMNQPETTLETTWLTNVATVRPPLARLEAMQLEARESTILSPLTAWTSSPGDPWQAKRVKNNLNLRDTTKPQNISHDPFVAAFGSEAAWQGTNIAVMVMDSFSEAIPMPHRATSTAFGFNAPAARAPQAILLAVPPVPRQPLDEELLLQTLIETRELAHARTARLEDLGEWQSLVPTMGLHTSGSPHVWLERWPLFE